MAVLHRFYCTCIHDASDKVKLDTQKQACLDIQGGGNVGQIKLDISCEYRLVS